MGFGKVVKKLKSGSESGTLIGAFRSAILKTNSYYSPRLLHHRAKHFVSTLENKEATNASLFFSFFEVYDMFYGEKDRSIGYHPSSLSGDCPRMLFYAMSGETPKEKKASITAQLQLTFDIGTMLHTYFQFKLYKSGLLIDCEVPVKLPNGITGHADGVLMWDGIMSLLEIKTMNSFSFSKLYEPVKKHISQASIYAMGLGLKVIIFLYIDKNTSDIKVFKVDVDQDAVDVADIKAESVNKAVTKGVAPERVCLNIISEQALSCPFVDICFKK